MHLLSSQLSLADVNIFFVFLFNYYSFLVSDSPVLCNCCCGTDRSDLANAGSESLKFKVCFWSEQLLFFCSFVEELCSSLLLHGKPLNDPFIQVRNAPHKFLVHREHSQNIEVILHHGVSQEAPLQNGEAPLSHCHGHGHDDLEEADTL